MNIFLWVLQVLLALHTGMGAVWKFFNSSQEASFQAIPQGVWLAMAVAELLCAVALLLPAASKRFAILAPVAAGLVAAEMLVFCAVEIQGAANYGHMIYWLVVAAICAFVAYGRLVLKPL